MMLVLIACIAVVVMIKFIFDLSRRKERESIFGIYSQPGKWYPVKFLAFLLIYYMRMYCFKSSSKKSSAGQGVKALTDIKQMEKAQQLSDHPLAFDAIFFIGVDTNDNDESTYVVIGCERRKMGICMEPLYIILPGKGLLCGKKLPDTLTFGAQPDQFGAEGLIITPVEPMKKWKISYKGQMWYQHDPNKLVNVEFACDWLATNDYYDFDSDLCPDTVVRSIAREPWSREYFNHLKTAHQSHYEQFGIMNTICIIDGQQHQFILKSFRDHSFGHKRVWSLMHRYVFHQIFLENNVKLVVGVICQPSTASRFEVGYVCLENGKIEPLEWCDFELYQHGENGKPPQEYAFSFKASHKIYTVQVTIEYEATHYVSFNWEAKMIERFARYNVNGVRGIGVTEWHYNHKGGRPKKYAENDPEWYKKTVHK